jgi:hypothetical protein
MSPGSVRQPVVCGRFNGEMLPDSKSNRSD